MTERPITKHNRRQKVDRLRLAILSGVEDFLYIVYQPDADSSQMRRAATLAKKRVTVAMSDLTALMKRPIKG